MSDETLKLERKLRELCPLIAGAYLQHIADAVSRAGLALVPAADVQPISDETLRHLRECALAWEPEARLLGNITAHQLRAFCLELAKLRRDVPTPQERAVLEACALIRLDDIVDEFGELPEFEEDNALYLDCQQRVAEAELARRAAKEAKGG